VVDVFLQSCYKFHDNNNHNNGNNNNDDDDDDDCGPDVWLRLACSAGASVEFVEQWICAVKLYLPFYGKNMEDSTIMREKRDTSTQTQCWGSVMTANILTTVLSTGRDDTEVIAAVASAFPYLVCQQNALGSGHTPLMTFLVMHPILKITFCNKSIDHMIEILEILLKVNPGAAAIPTSSGWLPLHRVCCSPDPSSKAIKMLLQTYPEGASATIAQHQQATATPLSLLYDEFGKLQIHAMRRNEMKQRMQRFKEQVTLIIQATMTMVETSAETTATTHHEEGADNKGCECDAGTGTTSSSSEIITDEAWKVLEAAGKLGQDCPWKVLEFLMASYFDNNSCQNSNSHNSTCRTTPLHFVCAFPTRCDTNISERDDDGDNNFNNEAGHAKRSNNDMSAVDIMVRHGNPEAISQLDGRGRLPLHVLCTRRHPFSVSNTIDNKASTSTSSTMFAVDGESLFGQEEDHASSDESSIMGIRAGSHARAAIEMDIAMDADADETVVSSDGSTSDDEDEDEVSSDMDEYTCDTSLESACTSVSAARDEADHGEIDDEEAEPEPAGDLLLREREEEGYAEMEMDQERRFGFAETRAFAEILRLKFLGAHQIKRNCMDMLTLLDAFPGACEVRDRWGGGRLPLHLAIANGRGWTPVTGGLIHLVEYEPTTIRERDPVTRLFPFMLAAATAAAAESNTPAIIQDKTDATATTIYELLRLDPSLVVIVAD
jgi:hypothetical protein